MLEMKNATRKSFPRYLPVNQVNRIIYKKPRKTHEENNTQSLYFAT